MTTQSHLISYIKNNLFGVCMYPLSMAALSLTTVANFIVNSLFILDVSIKKSCDARSGKRGRYSTKLFCCPIDLFGRKSSRCSSRYTFF